MLKLKLKYFRSLMQRANSMEKNPVAGKDSEQEERGRQRIRWLDGITDTIDMSEQTSRDGEGQGSLSCCSPQGCRVGYV